MPACSTTRRGSDRRPHQPALRDCAGIVGSRHPLAGRETALCHARPRPMRSWPLARRRKRRASGGPRRAIQSGLPRPPPRNSADPKYIEAVRANGFTFRSMDVGVVLDLMIHDIDLVLSLVRSPLWKVEALGVSVLGGHEDVANARLEFESWLRGDAFGVRASATSRCGGCRYGRPGRLPASTSPAAPRRWSGPARPCGGGNSTWIG